ncbi:hypothetical protein [Sphaerisporangium aureirubrum]|uniref:Uncharacterized protein n=1 Tax=Sphaerisporangium aureirubrum TaxID=1544736 RepID=A0ABW1NKZ6_9ACTN
MGTPLRAAAAGGGDLSGAAGRQSDPVRAASTASVMSIVDEVVLRMLRAR